MDNILEDLIKEIPAIFKYKDRPLLSILKYIDIVSNGDKGFIELSESEDLSKNYLRKGFYEGKIDNMLPALELINNSFNKSCNDRYSNLELVDSIINQYEIIYEWKPEDKFLFPCNRYGNFALKVIIKLMNSEKMKEFIDNDYERYKFIIENQIYVVDEKSVNNFIYLLLTDIGCEFKRNIFTGEFLYDKFVKHSENEWGIKKFTATFCDPEYIDSSIRKNLRSTTSAYIYHKYILKSIYFSNIVNCITPANWMQTNSNKLKFLSSFRNKLKLGNHIRYINYLNLNNQNVKNDDFIVNSGGLSKFLYDFSYKGECCIDDEMVDLSKIDVIPTNSKNLELIYILNDYCKNNSSLKSIYDGLSGCLKSNDSRLHSEEIEDVKNIKIITSNHSTNFYGKRNIGYMFCSYGNLHYFEKKNLNKWKVLIPETCTSAGKGLSSNMIISGPQELYTNTFGVFIVNSEEEAKSLVSYLKTDLVDIIISELKIKNHINKHIMEYIPNVPLDRIWDSKSIFKYLNIPENLFKEEEIINVTETILLPVWD